MAEKEVVEAAIGALERTSNTIDFWLLIFTCVVALGVIGEAIFGVAHLLNANKLAPLRAREGQLTALEISSANDRAQQANLEILRMKMPRSLNDDIFVKEIAGKPKWPVVELLYMECPDCSQLAMQVAAAINRAGWGTPFPKPIRGPNVASELPADRVPMALTYGAQPSGGVCRLAIRQ